MLITLLMLGALAAPPVELPNSDTKITFDADASGVIDTGLADLAAGRFSEAATHFGALADAGGGAGARYLEALARYESGDLRRADRASAAGIQLDPTSAPLLTLRGLILRDLGRGNDALPLLEQAVSRAVARQDAESEARALLHRGLVLMDKGDPAAQLVFENAVTKASAAGVADVQAAATANLSLLQSRRGQVVQGNTDPLARVVEALRQGKQVGERPPLPPVQGVARRPAIAGWRARAAVARADGDVDTAARALGEALQLARSGGLLLETASVLGEIAVVHQLIGRWSIAQQQLDEAVGLLVGTHFQVEEVGWRIEAGRVALQTGRRGRAREQLDKARQRVSGPDFPGAERLDELTAALAATGGDDAAAQAAWQRVVDVYEARGWWADAARVSTAAVRALPPGSSADAWHGRAEASFRRAQDPLGPAHLHMARGLAAADARDLDVALTAFAAARESAQKVDTAQAKRVAAIANENAAQALVALGHGEQAARRGLDDAVARHQRFSAAEQAYRQGLQAYDSQDYTQSRSAFDASFKSFRDLGETGYATAARRGRAWSAWNQAVAKPTAEALPFLGEIEQEAIMVSDPELQARASAAHALAMSELNTGDPLPRLRAAADLAEAQGLDDVAARVWGELAEQEADFVERARAARRALQLSADAGGIYAMYSVAVDAANADQVALAESLAREVLPIAGDLKPAVQEVLDAISP